MDSPCTSSQQSKRPLVRLPHLFPLACSAAPRRKAPSWHRMCYTDEQEGYQPSSVRTAAQTSLRSVPAASQPPPEAVRRWRTWTWLCSQ